MEKRGITNEPQTCSRAPSRADLFSSRVRDRMGRHSAARPDVRLGRRDDVARIFAAADAVVSSSAFGEGFSNVLAEGMACGLPAISTDVGDARSIVGDSGIIVRARDPCALAAAVRAVARESNAVRMRLAEQARVHIEKHFALSQAVKRYSDLYESLMRPAGLT